MEQGRYTGKILEQFNNDELFVLVSFFSKYYWFFFLRERENWRSFLHLEVFLSAEIQNKTPLIAWMAIKDLKLLFAN